MENVTEGKSRERAGEQRHVTRQQNRLPGAVNIGTVAMTQAEPGPVRSKCLVTACGQQPVTAGVVCAGSGVLAASRRRFV